MLQKRGKQDSRQRVCVTRRKVLDKGDILRYTACCKEKDFTGGMLCMVLSRSRMRL